VDDAGFVSGRVGFFSLPQHPDQLWGLPSLFPLGTGVLSSGVEVAGARSQITQLHLVPKLMHEAVPLLCHTYV
jgi:hypothetical protein